MTLQRAAAAFALLFWLSPSIAEACECDRVTPFRDVAKTAAIVFTGKVVAVYVDPRVAKVLPDYADVEVESVAKGRVKGIVRVWDHMYGWSCGGSLRGLKVGMRAEFAVDAEASWEPWDIKPGAPVPHPTVPYAYGPPWRERGRVRRH